MMAQVGYAQILRAIGQALEVIQIQDFELEFVGQNIVVRGVSAGGGPSPSGHLTSDQLRAFWGAVPELTAEREPITSELELCYSRSDVDRLDRDGRGRRSPSSAPADASRLSQALRGIGGYLDSKRAQLTRLRRNRDAIAAEYHRPSGSAVKETFGIQEIYDLWVRMYLQRAERAAH